MRSRISKLGWQFVSKPGPWALVALVIMFLGAAQHYSRTARAQSPHAGANAVAWQTLQSAQHVPTSYRGRAETVSKLTSGAVPLAMASADFDGDGIADLVIGYAHSSGGILAVHRGNLDAFAPQSHASWLAIAHEQFPSPFLPQATVIDVPEAPQFVVTGDFSGNGDVGILTGARGSQNLYLFAGNGKGKFSAPQIITLPGALTALAAGQVGARDGKTDVVAGVQTAQAAAVLVYKGSAGGLSQTAVSYPVPQPATQLEIADLHGDGISDVAVLAGGEVLIVHPTAQAGDDTSALIERVPAGSARSIAVGGFVWDRKSRNQLAVLSQSGIVQVLSPEELDTRPFTKEEMHIRRTPALRAQLPSEMNPLWSGESHPWNVVKSGAVSAPMSGNVRLMAAGLAHTRPLDLMVVDSSDSRLHVLPANTTYDNSDDSRELTIETGDAPAAVLPARVNVDGRRGLVMVGRSASHPKTMSPLPDPTYTVNRLDDIAPRGTGVTCITPASTDCTFREAVIKANANAGADTIMLPAGTITLTITGQGEGLAATGDVDVTDSLTIIGTVSSGIPTSIITGGAGWNDKFISVNKEGTSDADLSVSNVIFQNGNNTNLVATELGYDALGGAVAFYGCAAEGGGCTVGSGSSSLSITNVQFLNNSIGNNALTGCSGSANIDCGGGLLSQFGDTTISGSTFTGNKATNGRGGALVLQGAKETMTVSNSKFTGNTSGIEGGAIEIDFQNGYATGIITIHSSTISTNTSGNYTAADGGGLHVNLGNGSAGPGTTATANIDQETVISGNSGDRGGAIVFEGTSGPSPNHTSLTISKVTITGNHATGASSDGGGGIFVPDAGTLNIQYSRIAGNTSAHGGKPTGISIEPVGATINAADNWWGCNTGPSASPCDTVGIIGGSGATVTDTPYIVLTLGAVPSTLQPQPPGTTSSALTADFLHESSGTIALINIDVLIGLPITFGGTAGSISSPQATIQSNGQATATFTHDATCNASSANATVDTNPAPTVTTPITTVCPDLTATKANSLGVSGATTPLASPNWTWTVTAANGAAGTAPALFTAGETILSDNLPSTNISSYGTPTPSNFVGITNSVNISCGIASNVLTCIASGADVTIGTGGSFKVSFTATATAAGSYTNPTAGSCTVDPNHDIIEFSESNNSCGPDTVMVLAPPVISKVFGGSIPVGGNTSLTFTITNPAVNTVSLLGVGVTDPLPTGLTVATSAPTATCGGTLTTTAPTTITLAGATVAPGVPCVFSVTVTGATPGSYTNTTGNVTSTNGGTGNQASAPLIVKANTTTTVTSSANPSVFNQSVTFTATVAPVAPGTGTPTGTVNFLDGATTIGTGTLSGGVATFSISTLSVGSHTITTTYGGDANFVGSSGALTGNPQVVNKADTTTAVTSSLNPSSLGQSVTFTATVAVVPPGAAPTVLSATGPTGSVTFLDGGTPIGSGTLSGGVATFTTTALGVGNHTITTSYLGDPNYNGSTGSMTGNPQVVNKGNPATAVTSSVNPSILGQSVTFTATVTAVAPATGTPTGSVTFLDGGSPIGSGTLSGGVATLTTSSLSLGSHTITTSYLGDATFNGSTGSMTGNPQVVNKASTATAVTSSVNPSVVGQPVTFTATVTAVAPGTGTPTGSVTFLDGGSAIGSGTLSGGVATLTTSALAGGNHTITTSYPGDPSFNGSTGSLTGNPQVVNKANSTTAVTSSLNPSVFGQPVTFTATVAAVAPGTGTPSGSVTFLDGGSPIGSGTLSGGVATFATSALATGPHTITTSYPGDPSFNGSTGVMTGNPQVVSKANTTTAVTSSVNPSVFGQSVTFTATVSPVAPGGGTPTGSVTFLDGGSPIGTGTLSSGIATFSTSALAVASHTITTSYSGDGNFNGSTGSLTGNPQVVNKANSATAVTSSQNPSVVGQPVTFTATVSAAAPGAGTPGGNVTFLDGGSPIGTGTLSGGVATLTTSALTLGSHTITTSYSGDGNFNGSTGSLTGNPQVVTKASSATTVTSTPNPSKLGQSVTFTATVAAVAPGTGTPTGSVTFLNGGSPIGSGPLSGGVATFATSSLPAGNNTITASYPGDGNFNGSTGSLTGNPQVVVAPPTISKAFVPPNILVGGTTALVFTLTNPSANTVAESGVAFSDTLTGGLQVASTPGVITNCGGGFIGATAGSTSLAFSGGAIPINSSCTVSVNITATSYGLKTNITGPVSSTNGGTGTTSNTATLSVGQPPAFTSANNATFTIGVPGSFTVTTSGAPTPSITESGHLPTGLTFVDNGNGTGTLSGTPLVFIGGDFNISFTAQNGVGSPAVQPFTIILQQAPAFTSANNAVFVYGVPNSFTVTTVGFPVPSIHESGTLPPWLTFVDHGNGTATLSGTPSYTSGTFSLVLTATNVVTTATQNFTLTVSGLSLSPSNLSFGSVYLNSSHTMSVTATNVGSTNVTVSGVGITPGTADAAAYTFVNHCTTPLKPGKSCTIAVTFLADAVGTLTATLNITDNTVGSPQHVSLTGTVIDPVAQFNPTKLTFGTHAVGSSTTLPVQLTNTGQTPLNISNIGVVGTNAGDFSQANNCPAILAPTMSCTISVTFTPTVAGSRTGTLTVTDNVAAGKSTVALTGTGH